MKSGGTPVFNLIISVTKSYGDSVFKKLCKRGIITLIKNSQRPFMNRVNAVV